MNENLIIKREDWILIFLVGIFFGLSISLLFYSIVPIFKTIWTPIFSIIISISTVFISFILITISNLYILPKIKEKFWTMTSFFFAFSAGFLGFFFSFYISLFLNLPFIEALKNFSLLLSFIFGSLTFLIGFILHILVTTKYKNETIKRQHSEQRLKTLEGELNPHFLFNALNSMSELVYIDSQKAEKAILNLSSFLRSAINKESLIPLELELEMVSNYVEIENIRFNHQILLEFNILEKFKQRFVPKFSIQLLVENAIKHGFEHKTLNIKIENSEKNICVSNNGKQPENIIYGTGLSNLKDRLEILNIGKLYYKKDKKELSFCIEWEKK